MEVLPLPPPPFPSASTPTSPTRLVGAFRSAPSSPPRISDLLLDDLDSDFAFHVAADLDDSLFFAEELFDGGRIKAAQQPPPPPVESPPHVAEERGRGRGKGLDGGALSRSCRRGARSLSPVRSGKDIWRVEVEGLDKARAAVVGEDPPPERVAVSAARGSRKWSLKDLLFRSASEGHASDKHAPRFGGAWVPGRRGEAPARKTASSSAHERHYIWKKAASEDMKKKTFLPYKQGILGRFSFTGLGGHAPARSRR